MTDANFSLARDVALNAFHVILPPETEHPNDGAPKPPRPAQARASEEPTLTLTLTLTLALALALTLTLTLTLTPTLTRCSTCSLRWSIRSPQGATRWWARRRWRRG